METCSKKIINYKFLPQPIEIYERECGHKIVFAHKEGGLVNISTWVKTGSINENDENNGISHFLEHLMFKGTSKYKAGYFDKTLEAKGAIVNAATWKDYTFYYVTLPKGPNNEYFNCALELHADMMSDPVIPPEEIGEPFIFGVDKPEIKRERHVVIEEIRMRKDQPWTLTYNQCNHAMYSSHPYKRDVIGTPQIISEIKRETILDYYKKYYAPNNMTTIVVGDFNHEETLEKILKLFDFSNREKIEKTLYPIDEPTQSTKIVECEADINTSFIIYGYLCPVARDIKSTIALEILSVILGEGQSSRLNQNLIEKVDNPIFNALATDYYTFRDGGNFFIDASLKAGCEDTGIQLINEEIKKLCDEVSDEEFLKAKKKLKINFARDAETVSDIADTIGYYMTVCDDLDLMAQYLDVLESLSKEEVLALAKEKLNINHATISILKPKKGK